MNFERHKDIKRNLQVGQINNVREIVGLSEIHRFQDDGWDKEVVTQTTNLLRIKERDHIIRVLVEVESIELNPEDYAVIFWPSEDEKDPDTAPFEICIDMAEYMGKYVKYDDHIYKIPSMEDILKKDNEQV